MRRLLVFCFSLLLAMVINLTNAGIILTSPAWADEDSNIDFVFSVFPTQESWDEVFSIASTDPACTGSDILSYDHFLEAVDYRPDFLTNPTQEENMRELAAFLAHVSLETNGAGPGQYNGGLCFAEEVDCRDAYCDYCTGMGGGLDESPACLYGYYGRGALQITNPDNYLRTSNEVFGDERLWYNPDLMLEGTTAWDASLAFWLTREGGLIDSKTTVPGLTTCHEAIVTYNDFGKTVEVINGNLECENPDPDFIEKTRKRGEYYKTYLQDFSDKLGLFYEEPDNLTCAGD
ncbi:MAG: hypothetical protein F6K41_08275 [Symploca sp. SIO3E6]|nr:hypothetical protein [Caldora sp. SIO3E6]